ncbi:MAG: hypothetical protein ABSA76_00945 [Bacteroidales bacterium]
METETIFIPSTKPNSTIKDVILVRLAVNSYFACDYQEMKGFILEYGEKDFFDDLVTYLEAGHWRNPSNKYRVFRGMVIAFFDIY